MKSTENGSSSLKRILTSVCALRVLMGIVGCAGGGSRSPIDAQHMTKAYTQSAIESALNGAQPGVPVSTGPRAIFGANIPVFYTVLQRSGYVTLSIQKKPDIFAGDDKYLDVQLTPKGRALIDHRKQDVKVSQSATCFMRNGGEITKLLPIGAYRLKGVKSIQGIPPAMSPNGKAGASIHFVYTIQPNEVGTALARTNGFFDWRNTKLETLSFNGSAELVRDDSGNWSVVELSMYDSCPND